MNQSSLNQEAMKASKDKWNSIAKPLNSLGKLEEAVVKLSGIFGSHDQWDIRKKCVVVMCADNGVVHEGVTQTGQEVTRIVAENMTKGKATINVLANQAGADVFVVDVGMVSDLDMDEKSDAGESQILNRKVMYGTKNFLREPAMTVEQAQKAIQVGMDMVKNLKDKGYKVIATGEMGIGNTTTSSAMTAAYLNMEVAEVTGRGAGLDDAGLNRKVEVIGQSLAKWKPESEDALDVLSSVGGLDIAGMAGLFLGGAKYGIPVLVDGFISSVAALTALKLNPDCHDYMFATHISKEPAGRKMIEVLDLPYLLDMHLCLGEGTGAVFAFKLLDMAVAVYQDMTDFEEAKIETYIPYEELKAQKSEDGTC